MAQEHVSQDLTLSVSHLFIFKKHCVLDVYTLIDPLRMLKT